MNTYYNNKTHSMYLNFALDENGNDRVRIGSVPRTDTGAFDTKNGIAVVLYKNSFKTTKEGNPNYRNVEVFYKTIVDIVKQYKDNPETATKQFSCTYTNAVTNHTMQFAFGVLEKDGLPAYVLYLSDSFEGKTRKQIYKFKDEQEVEQFTDQLKLFCDEWVHMTSHLIYSEMQKIVTKAVGEQLQHVVTDAIATQYPGIHNIVHNAVSDCMRSN